VKFRKKIIKSDAKNDEFESDYLIETMQDIASFFGLNASRKNGKGRTV